MSDSLVFVGAADAVELCRARHVLLHPRLLHDRHRLLQLHRQRNVRAFLLHSSFVTPCACASPTPASTCKYNWRMPPLKRPVQFALLLLANGLLPLVAFRQAPLSPRPALVVCPLLDSTAVRAASPLYVQAPAFPPWLSLRARLGHRPRRQQRRLDVCRAAAAVAFADGTARVGNVHASGKFCHFLQSNDIYVHFPLEFSFNLIVYIYRKIQLVVRKQRCT